MTQAVAFRQDEPRHEEAVAEAESERECDSARIVITEEMIARRAFEIWLTLPDSTPEANWARAERELRAEAKAC